MNLKRLRIWVNRMNKSYHLGLAGIDQTSNMLKKQQYFGEKVKNEI